MIKVEYKLSEDKQNIIMSVKGHAGYAENGRDLVCAVATGYVHQLAQVVLDMYDLHKLRKKPTVHVGVGEALIVAKPLKSTFKEVANDYWMNQRGFEVMAHSYPEYVSLKKLDVLQPLS